jgi:hypothetical protein
MFENIRSTSLIKELEMEKEVVCEREREKFTLSFPLYFKREKIMLNLYLLVYMQKKMHVQFDIQVSDRFMVSFEIGFFSPSKKIKQISLLVCRKKHLKHKKK